MNGPEQFVIAYWLLPAVPFQDFFRETIRRLVVKYDAPFFEPHLTLAVRPDCPAETERRLARLRLGAVELRPIGIAFDSAFTKAFFLRFESHPSLHDLRVSLGVEDNRGFDPHLSLLYKKLPVGEQSRLASEIQLPFSSVTFDMVAATRCRLPVATAADVDVWESVASRGLIREEAD